ncbi:MAG: chemotaxis protein CheD, partial [Deltaproteobacteria bacterium]|nr:chemotaxis protein CheD [Deltaproteobacteria bacterium]
PMLIEKMIALGCRKENLMAKVFGGSSMLETSSGLLNIGERNTFLADKMLADEKIGIMSRDAGGNSGRKIMFVSNTGEVFVKRLNKQQSA